MNDKESASPGAGGDNTAAVMEHDQGGLATLADVLSDPDRTIEFLMGQEPGGEDGEEIQESGDGEPVSEAAAVAGAGDGEDGPGNDPPEGEDPAKGDEPDDEPKGIEKRIHELTAQKNHLKGKLDAKDGELADLREQLATASQQLETVNAKRQANAPSPLEGVQTMAELNAKLADAQDLEDWAIENLDGAEIVDAEGETKELNAKQVRGLMLNAKRILREGQRRAQEIQQAEASERSAVEVYPWWEQPESQEHQVAQKLMARNPELARHPQAKLVIGDLMVGMAVRIQRANGGAGQGAAASPSPTPAAAAAAAAAPAPKPAKVPGGMGSSAGAIAAGRARAPAVPGGSPGGRGPQRVHGLLSPELMSSNGSEADLVAAMLGE